MKVSELMKREVQACSVHDNLERAARIMWECDCGCVPVVDDDARVVGMLTDRDVCMAGYTQGKPYAEILVTSAMATKVFGVDAQDQVEVAEAIMRTHRVRRLPVFEGTKLVGILSLSDVATHAHKARGQSRIRRRELRLRRAHARRDLRAPERRARLTKLQ